MYIHNEPLPTPEENLAFDEALVEVADRLSMQEPSDENSAGESSSSNEVLRLWEFASPCVVLGRASKWAQEVNTSACERDGVPVLRRASGGASIVAGPGCLMYSVLISYDARPAWRALDIAHKEVMSRIRDSVQQTTDRFELPLRIAINGTCDLTIGNRKFSGNALRCKRNWMLYHGTIMYAMPIEWLSNYLLMPARQPEYRRDREHESFVTNLLDSSNGVSPQAFRTVMQRKLARTWNATQSWLESPWKSHVDLEASQLLKTRYTNSEWHRSR